MWYKRYGFKANPFVIESHREIFVGFEELKKKVVESIDSNDIVLITGPYGSGKTAFLLWLRGFLNYAGHKPIYLDGADFQLFSDMRELYQQINSHIRGGFWQALKGFFRKRKKLVVFLIDEAQSIPKGFAEILKSDKDRGYIDSLIFASSEVKLASISESLRSRINEFIPIGKMDFDTAMEMIERRAESVGGKNPFEPQALRYICEYSDWIPRDILKNCEKVAKELAYERSGELIKVSEAKKILKKRKQRRSRKK